MQVADVVFVAPLQATGSLHVNLKDNGSHRRIVGEGRERPRLDR